MEGIHDRPRAGEFFSGCAFESGESIHRDDLNAFAPGVGLGGQPGFENLLGAARDHVQEVRGAAAFSDGCQIQDDGDVFVAVGVWRHTCSSTPMTRTPSHRAGSLISRCAPSARTAVLAALPGHTEGLGDARHRQMVDHQARQRPAHRRTRELRARIGRLTHVLTPHVSTRLAPVAAHAHMQDRGTPPAGLMRQAPDHRVTSHALAPAASTPPVLTSNPASQHCMVCLNALARHF